MAPNGPHMAPTGSQMAQNAPQMDPNWPRMGPNGAQKGRTVVPNGPKWSQSDPKMVQKAPQITPDAPKWSQMLQNGPRRDPNDPKWYQMLPKCSSILDNVWHHVWSIFDGFGVYQNGPRICEGGPLEGKPSAGNLADPPAGTSCSTLSQLKESLRAPRGRGSAT